MQDSCSGVRQCERRRQLTRSRQRRTSVLGGGLLTSYPAALLLVVLVLATTASAAAVAAAGQRAAISSGPRRTKRMKNDDQTREEDLRDPYLAEHPRRGPSKPHRFLGSGIDRGNGTDHHDEETHTREMSREAGCRTLQALHTQMVF
ncbi:hypothetical protein KPH14_005434 [Odynerus spinipes]|uniref:Uncharacterized protein n=1 Tax=Odynerus spinipes TaxID=1348599 RepID=A0AAD9VJD6_9HYME|nr:hypothetical protein KPH14_005434 [Odynerus spinipes]